MVNYLVRLGTPEARVILEKIANNDKEYWPPYIPWAWEKKVSGNELRKVYKIDPDMQKVAQEALKKWEKEE